MASSQFPILRTPEQPQQSRVQDGIANVMGPVARALQNTPIMGAPAPAWIRPDFLNGWVNTGAPYALVAFHKDALGYVHTKGVFTNGTGGALILPIFAFPMGYRPAETQSFAVTGPGVTIQFLNVDGAGVVTPLVAVGAGGVSCLGFTFLAEQ